MMRLTYAIGLALLLALVAGCGEESGADAATGAGAPDGTRTVSHAMGTTEITGLPERVVVLDTGELDSAVALGVTPVGAVEAIAGAGFPDYLAERIEGVEKVGTIEQPSIEAIAALQPDLILSSKLRHEAIYDRLSRIAPTVFTEEVGVTWKENFRLHAEALGRVEEAARLDAEYRQAVEALGTEAGTGPPKVSVVRSVGDEVRIYANANFVGTILRDAGFPRPEPQDADEFSITVTRERIPAMDGDVMIFSRFGDDHRLMEQLTESALWTRLGVVSRDAIFEVPDDLWFLGIGNLAARLVVEDMRTILIEGGRLPGDEPGSPLT